MNSHCIFRCFVISIVMLASISGCSKKEDSAETQDEVVSEANMQVAEPEAKEQPISPLMEQFLGKISKTKKATAGHGIGDFFAFWQELLHNPRISMKIYFDVDVDGKFQRDHVWENKSNREILDEFCQEYNLTWVITDSDTIHITKKPE